MAGPDGGCPVVLVGPVCVGKSRVGPRVATLLGRELVEVDDLARGLYGEHGWTVARFADLQNRCGMDAAYDDFETVVAAAVIDVLASHRDAVIAMGAGHTHFRVPDRREEVAAAFARAAAVTCLLLPCPDLAEAVQLLRDRAIRDRGDDFRRDGRDLLHEWVHSEQTRRLADATVLTAGRNPDQTADDIVAAVRRIFAARSICPGSQRSRSPTEWRRPATRPAAGGHW